MRFVVHATSSAEQDAAEAAEWYEEREPGLGSIFQMEVQRAVYDLATSALRQSIRFSDVRRAPVFRFPAYGIFYLVREDQVTIFALIHSARSLKWVRQRRRTLED